MKIELTSRGFAVANFVDRYGHKCSLQESSLAGEGGHIWLGCDDIGLKRFEPGKGWSDVTLQQDDPHGITHTANTRMHLSQGMVRERLPLLQYFARHGELPQSYSAALEDD
jgi:hypothetical protein